MRLHPFRALHPTPASVRAVVSPPYDVMSTPEARAMVHGNPLSFLHVVRPEVDLPEGTDPHADEVYDTARANLERLVERGALVRDEQPALWLYQLKMGDHTQTGYVGCAEVEDYAQGRIKKHEHTRRDKEDDRARHVDTTNANTGPVFLTCRGTKELTYLPVELADGPPDLDVVGPGGVRHTLWAVRDRDALDRIAAAFEAEDAFYIADGHHRAASAFRARELRRARTPGAPAEAPWERFLAVVFPADALRIMPYNRVVVDLGDGQGGAPRTVDAFLEAVGERFEVGPPAGPASPPRRGTFSLYVGGAWRLLTPYPETLRAAGDDPVDSLDVALLQTHLLEPVLGIEDPRTDPRIDFVGGIRGTDELVHRVDQQGGGCAVSMYPTSIGDLLAVADAGRVMPPKSTWFEPKLASGLLVHPLSD